MQISNYTSSSNKINITNRNLLVINAIGFILSVYSYHISISKRTEPEYQALCDLSSTISCSKVLTSTYSTGFGVMRYFVDESSIWNPTNSAVGIFYYLTSAILSYSVSPFLCRTLLMLSVISNLSSVYLAGVLFILQDICVICVLTYFINALNYFFLSKKVEILNQNLNHLQSAKFE